VEISWFAALCDDDYEVLGLPDPTLASSFEHCADIVAEAERWGYDNILLPSGYALGIDTLAFAAAAAPSTDRIRLLVAVRSGEQWPPQLARQLATTDHLRRHVGPPAVRFRADREQRPRPRSAPAWRTTAPVRH